MLPNLLTELKFICCSRSTDSKLITTTLDEPWAALVVVVLTVCRLHVGDDRLHTGNVTVAVSDDDNIPVVATAGPPIAWKTDGKNLKSLNFSLQNSYEK